MCRCDTGAQCWVHRVNVKAAHFGARMLERKTTGGGHAKQDRNLALLGGKCWWNCLKFSCKNLNPKADISSGILSPEPLAPNASMQEPCVRVRRLLARLVKQQKESDRVTLWQANKTHWRQLGNLDVDCHSHYDWVWSSPRTIRTAKIWTATFASAKSDQVCKAPEPRLPSLTPADDGHPDCLLSPLLMTAIWSPRHQTVFSCSCWWQPYGLSSLTTAGDDLDRLLLILLSLISSAKLQTAIPQYRWRWSGLPQDLPTVIDEFCLHVKVSPWISLFAASRNIATSQPRHIFFCMLAHSAGGPGEWIPVEMVGQGVWIPPWKFQQISSMFTPWKRLSRLPILGSLDIDPVYSTLCPSITFRNKFSGRQCFRSRNARRNYLRPGLYNPKATSHLLDRRFRHPT